MFEADIYLTMLKNKGYESCVELYEWKETYIGVFASHEWFTNYLNMPVRPEARYRGQYGIYKDGCYMFWPIEKIKRVTRVSC